MCCSIISTWQSLNCFFKSFRKKYNMAHVCVVYFSSASVLSGLILCCWVYKPVIHIEHVISVGKSLAILTCT